jgi:hypothetical protein
MREVGGGYLKFLIMVFPQNFKFFSTLPKRVKTNDKLGKINCNSYHRQGINFPSVQETPRNKKIQQKHLYLKKKDM